MLASSKDASACYHRENDLHIGTVSFCEWHDVRIPMCMSKSHDDGTPMCLSKLQDDDDGTPM
jgi:hypothetical protein